MFTVIAIKGEVMTDYYANKAANKYYEEKRRSERPGMFRGTNYVTGAQLNAEDEQRRLLEQQALKNRGALDVVEREQSGATTRQTLADAGALKRKQLEENRLLSRLGFDREKFGQEITQRRNESDEDFWLRRQKQMQEAKQFDITENRLRDFLSLQKETEENKNLLETFKALNQGIGIDEINNYDQNRLNFLRTMMSPEAEAVLNQRALGTIDTEKILY